MHRKPYILITGDDESGIPRVWLWVAKHKAYLPWKFDDAIHTPQWKAFVADACAKSPGKRSADEKRAIEISLLTR